jgi:hypothetical protein
MRKEVAYRLVLCNTMHKQNLTFHFKFVKARSVLDSLHMLDVLLNVKLVYLVTCQYLEYTHMASKAQNGSGFCSFTLTQTTKPQRECRGIALLCL